MINMDSIQMYKHLEIGSAKPSDEELSGINHFLFSEYDYPDTATASGVFDKVIKYISAHSYENYILCGGSGFYIKALCEGMFEIDDVDPQIRQSLEKQISENGSEDLYNEWLSIDPESAKKTSSNDHYRIVRALEIYRQFGKTISELQKTVGTQKPGLGKLGNVIKLGRNYSKEELNKRIEKRTQKMLSEGLVEEVEGIVSRGMLDWAPMASVGYKETVEFLSSKENASTEELFEKIVIKTRQLAKKQRTWLNREDEIHWLDGDLDLHQSSQSAINILNQQG